MSVVSHRNDRMYNLFDYAKIDTHCTYLRFSQNGGNENSSLYGRIFRSGPMHRFGESKIFERYPHLVYPMGYVILVKTFTILVLLWCRMIVFRRPQTRILGTCSWKCFRSICFHIWLPVDFPVCFISVPSPPHLLCIVCFWSFTPWLSFVDCDTPRRCARKVTYITSELSICYVLTCLQFKIPNNFGV